jgi:hypothetical protein
MTDHAFSGRTVHGYDGPHMVQLDLHPEQLVALVTELELARERALEQATQIARVTVGDEHGPRQEPCDEQALGQAHYEARLYERLLHGLAQSDVARAPTSLMYDLVDAAAHRAIDDLAQTFAARRKPSASGPTDLDLMHAGRAAHAWMVTYIDYHFVDRGPDEL